MRTPLVVSILLTSLPATVHAQGLIATRQQSLDVGGPVPVAVDGDRMAIADATYVREGGQWLPSEALLGTVVSVAGDGGRFVTGNTFRSVDGNAQSGIANVQSRSAADWVIEARLVPSDLRPRLDFGSRVAISGDTIAVHAPGWRPVGQGHLQWVGAVYVYRETAAGWVEEALLTPAGGDDYLGGGLALDGDTLVIGGRGAVPGGPATVPAVHVFQRSAGIWSPVTELLLSGGPTAGHTFFVAVQEEVPGTSATVVIRGYSLSRIFTGYGTSWQAQNLPDGTTGPAAFSGSLLALAYTSDSVPGVGTAGSVHLYQRGTSGSWQFRRKLYSSDPQAYHDFGNSLAMDGEWLAVGPAGQGSTFPMDLSLDLFRVLSVGATEFCTGLPNSIDEVTRIASSGSTSVSLNELELVAGPVPPGPGLFYYGGGQLQVPFGDGYRCVAPGGTGLYRLPQGAASNGLLVHPLDLNAGPAAGQILPGSTWNFQAWYRDAAAGGAGFNFSTGLELGFMP